MVWEMNGTGSEVENSSLRDGGSGARKSRFQQQQHTSGSNLLLLAPEFFDFQQLNGWHRPEETHWPGRQPEINIFLLTFPVCPLPHDRQCVEAWLNSMY